MEIRKAVIGDLKRIQELNLMLFDEELEKYDETINCDWPLSDKGAKFYRDRVEGDDGCGFVLIKDGEIVGYLVGSLSGDEFYRNVDSFAELDDMFILAEHRSGGYGGMLYDKFIEWCKEKGVKRLKVLVTVRNKGAIRFYKKKGFEDYNVTLERVI